MHRLYIFKSCDKGSNTIANRGLHVDWKRCPYVDREIENCCFILN